VVFSVIAGRFYNQTTLPLAIGFICAGIIGLCLVNWAQRIKIARDQ